MNDLMISPIKYENEKLFLLDQTLLPAREHYVEMKCKEDVWEAIHKLRVRGAPAIGVAAAFGLVISIRAELSSQGKAGKFRKEMSCPSADEYLDIARQAGAYLISSRPTAVNLEWAVNRMLSSLEYIFQLYKEKDVLDETVLAKIDRALIDEASAIREEDIASCKAMGEYGLSLLKPQMGILTHCNAGTIATAKYGTCLSPLYLGHERGFDFKVFADETRPLLQGARLTAWELNRAGIDVTLICDNMASIVMSKGQIDAVVVGCDRLAANGDGANKIGTSAVAILAKEYGIPFYMFVPTSTIDMKTECGDDITIELRKGEEIYKMWYETPMAPEGIKTYNPSFDVTKAEYITAIVTEKGIVRPPYKENLAKLMGK